MKQVLFIILSLGRFALPASLALNAYGSEECRINLAASILILKESKMEPDFRSVHGSCLMRHFLDRPDVAQAVLKIIRDPGEDLFLREDLIEVFGYINQRRKVKIESNLGPKLGAQERDAVDKMVANASPLLALTQAVKAMDDISPTTKYEFDFLHSFGEIAGNEANHVQLRSTAMNALHNSISSLISSGSFEEKTVRGYLELVQQVTAKKDNGSYFTGAGTAYRNLSAQLGNRVDSLTIGTEKEQKRGLASPAAGK